MHYIQRYAPVVLLADSAKTSLLSQSGNFTHVECTYSACTEPNLSSSRSMGHMPCFALKVTDVCKRYHSGIPTRLRPTSFYPYQLTPCGNLW